MVPTVTTGGDSVPDELQSDKLNQPDAFLTDLKVCAPDAVIFTVLEPKLCRVSGPRFPVNIGQLYNSSYEKLTDPELKYLCKNTFQNLIVTQCESTALEAATRLQSKSGLWHDYRKGRITASVFHDAIHADMQNPPTSLLEKIMNCNVSFTNSAMRYGLESENAAVQQYLEKFSASHVNLKIETCGFSINPKYPYLGCTPDRRVTCDCHGAWILEIKSCYKYRSLIPCEIKDSTFFLKQHKQQLLLCNNSLKLGHRHYTQVQGQLAISELEFADFLCFTSAGLHVERIHYNAIFCKNMLATLKLFYTNCVLPEVLTHRQTHSRRIDGNSKAGTSAIPVQKHKSTLNSKLVCSIGHCPCGYDNDFDNMIPCCNRSCQTKWYHLKCVGVLTAPKGKWICPTCRENS